jgi:MATE family multidrug resistance protein
MRIYSVRLFSFEGLSLQRFSQIARIGVPSCLSIVVYAGVYFALLRTTLSPLGDAVLGGLSIGFNAFEGVAFPFFLGIAVAGSSLVGRNLGAESPEGARQTVRSMRILALVTGSFFALVFWFAGPVIVPLFTADPDVAREAIRYVQILAATQLFVAYEVMHEKALLGAGYTAPLFLVSVPGNILRLPLAWFLATHLGLGAAGVWWAINLSTVLKSAVLAAIVQRGRWLQFRPTGVSAGG